MVYDDSEVYQLLERWVELRGQGKELAVEELCAERPDLREGVERGVRKLRQMGLFIDRMTGTDARLPLAAKLAKANGEPATPGSRFQFLRPHRKGGLGEVFIAYDEECRREVALKRIQPTRLHDADSCRRFQLEAEITGQLEHPGIVPVYGLIRSPDGPPSYAMRLIQGETLKEAIERFHKHASTKDERRKEKQHKAGGERALAFRQLLNRFVTVCQTMAYAHSRGVIHRDLKPDNVILGKYGETIIVDWGLAKPVRGKGRELRDEKSERAAEVTPVPSVLVGDSVATERGQIVGTPRFMSPEQAAGRSDRVGPASDIYSLGVTLYCLLTGAIPFPDPREAGVAAVLDRVQRGKFRRPRQIQRKIAPALEAICLKAMALRPEDRYPSAQALADDLEHWLADEPVAVYREPPLLWVGRWARRHRALVASLAGLCLSALVASLLATALLSRANAQTRKEWERAEDNRKTAESSAARAKATLRFLTDNLLAEAAPEKNPRQKQVTVEEVLNKATQKIDKAFVGQPEVEASIREMIGLTYHRLGLYARAEPQLRRAVDLYRDNLGVEDPHTLEAVNNLFALLNANGESIQLGPLFEGNLELCRRVMGSDHPNSIAALLNFAALLHEQGEWAKAEPLFVEYVDACRRVFGSDHAKSLAAIGNLCEVLRKLGKRTEAEPLLRGNLDACRRLLGVDHPETLNTMNQLALLLKEQGNLTEAELLYRQLLEALQRVMGPEHPKTLTVGNNLAQLLRRHGKRAEAELLLRQNLEAHRRVLGADHPDALGVANNLGNLLLVQGNLAEAEPLLRQNVDACRRVLGPNHPETLRAVGDLGVVYTEEGRLAEAEPLLRQGLETCQRVLGSDHARTLDASVNLANLLRRQGKLAEAESLVGHTLEVQRCILGSEHTRTLATLNNVAALLHDQGKLDEAEPLFRENLEVCRRLSGPNHPTTLLALYNLAMLLSEEGGRTEAETLFREVLSLQKGVGADQQLLAKSLAGLGALLTKSNRAREAETLLRECLELRRKTLPNAHRLVAEAEWLLGSCLSALRRHAEAEPLLLASHKTLKSAQGVQPSALRMATERIIQLYEAWEKPEQASQWRAKRDQLTQPAEKPKDQ